MSRTHSVVFVLATALCVHAVAHAKPRRSVPSSVVRFDASHPEAQALAQASGLSRPGYKVGVLSAELVYTTNHWRKTRTAPLQYLRDHRQGFILKGVRAGRPVEFAIRARLGNSYNGFRSYDQQAEGWVNNAGRNYVDKTTPNP